MLDTSNTNNYHYITRHLEIHILGGMKLNHLDSLRVTLSVQKSKAITKLRHNIDLYNDNQVEKLVRKVAERIEIGTSVVRRTLQELTNALESYRITQLEKENADDFSIPQLTKQQEKQAIAFLRSTDLLSKTNEYIGTSGVIGEEVNRLLMYLIFTSRKSANPLHCISLGSSGTGKTHLQSKVAQLIPEWDIVDMTVLSENAFYYFNRTELQHKLILIEDLDGAENALYPLRELQSKKSITKRVSHKDRNGNTKTIKLTVEGPVCVAGCTTKESIYEDNSNRSFLLYIDESHEQDEKIMQYQRRASAGKVNEQDEYLAAELLRHVQQLLKPVKVMNPFAMHLSLPQSVFKPRRTNSHYLQFIEAITFYKQFQRESKVDIHTGEIYIETKIEDIQEANALLQEVLLRKSDLISGASRNYLESLKTYLTANKQTTFTNAEVRRNLRIKGTTLRRYHNQLLADNYIKKTNNNKYKGYIYEVVSYDEYTALQTQINTSLENCIAAMQSKPVSH
jgi:predicted transcriptional regulator